MKLFQPLYPDRKVVRGRQSAGPHYSDVEPTDLWLEVKHYKDQILWRTYLRKALEDRDGAGDPRPVAVVGRVTHGPIDNPHRKWTIHMPLEDFLPILKRSREDPGIQAQLDEARKRIADLEAMVAAKKQCMVCSGPIPRGKRRDALTCSKACKMVAYRKRKR